MSKSNDSPEEGQRSSPHAAPQNSEPLQRSSSHKERTDKAGEPWEIPMTPLRPRPQSTVSDTMVLKIDDLLEEEEDSAEGDEPLAQASLLPPRALPPLDFS